jgi:hypothetical protein
MNPRPSISRATGHNSDLKAGDTIRITGWLADLTYAVVDSFGNIRNFTDNPEDAAASQGMLRVVLNRNLVDLPIKIDAIDYPLAMMTAVYPGRAPYRFQENVTRFECAKIPAHYYEAVAGKGLPSFHLESILELPTPTAWITLISYEPPRSHRERLMDWARGLRILGGRKLS